MEDLIWLILVGLILYGIYFTYNSEYADTMSDFYNYNGHVVVNKIDRTFLIPSIVVLKSDTSRQRFFVDDIIYMRLDVGEEIDVRSFDRGY